MLQTASGKANRYGPSLPPPPLSGQGSLSFSVPDAGAAASLTFYAQAVLIDPTSVLWLGAGTTTVLLDVTL